MCKRVVVGVGVGVGKVQQGRVIGLSASASLMQFNHSTDSFKSR